jgi:thiol-disulfide isomerase/thioredoxin
MAFRRLTTALALAAGVPTAAAILLPSDASAQALAAHAWLGISMDGDSAAAGVRVGHVVRGSPAERAGIKEGDRITSVAGLNVAHGPDIVSAVAAHAIGDTIDVAFSRAGASQAVRVTLARMPSQDDMMRMDLVGAFAPTWKNVQGVSGVFPQSISTMRGKVVLLDFWATWCAPCRLVVPKLGDLQARYGAQGLSVLGVSTEDAQDVAQFAQRMSIRYPIGVDKHAETTRSYGVASLPTLIVIDKRGVVRDVDIGYDSSRDGAFEATIRALLSEPAPP